jgi:hypothetical protein
VLIFDKTVWKWQERGTRKSARQGSGWIAAPTGGHGACLDGRRKAEDMTDRLAAIPPGGIVPVSSRQKVEAVTAEAIRRLDLQLGLPLRTGQEAAGWNFALPPHVVEAGLVIVAALLILWLLISIRRDGLPAWPGRGTTRWENTEEPDGPPGSAAATGSTPEALARSGRFAEAMHLLLLQILTELGRRPGRTLADSLTSREIIRRLPLPDRGREALREIVTRVERAWFGDHPAGEGDYEECRALALEIAGVTAGPLERSSERRLSERRLSERRGA